MLNLKNTLDGYLKNVEVIGNTVQDTNNLADIRSVGDKVEGQELYNISIQVDNGEGVSEVVEILSPVQLEKVGDVADRIICKDGVWGIEKNIDTVILNGDLTLYNYMITSSAYTSASVSTYPIKEYICVSSIGNKTSSPNEEVEGVFTHKSGAIYFSISKSKVANFEELGSWLYKNPITVKYITTQPTFIPLPHDQQVKLRTFAGQTNIAFLTEIPGQIKAQVPKSLGATVNTHTEQIADLHNSLERVKKLEETTVSTVETESSFTTVNETSKGYFEDVKLEGKTLVNLCSSLISHVVGGSTGTRCIIETSIPIDPLKDYTVVFEVYDSIGDTIGPISFGIGWSKGVSVKNTNGIKVLKVPKEYVEANGQPAFYFMSNIYNAGARANVKNVVLLEGDHTNNPPEYFEGIMSVGQDVEGIGVESVNENLWSNGRVTIGTDNNIPKNAYAYVYLKRGEYVLSCNYTNDSDSSTSFRFLVKRNNSTGEVISGLKGMNNSFIINDDGMYYIAIDRTSGFSGKVTSGDIYLTLLSNFTQHITHQSNKKPLLYYNPTTEMWEKPILREWDTIEKHSDGKYYYHQRSGEVVLNGSENFKLNSNFNTVFGNTETVAFGYTIRDYLKNLAPNTILCDAFRTDLSRTDDIDGIYNFDAYAGFNTIVFKILKGKLATQDVEGFKAWLKANPTKLVYKLEQEEVYECTNIDLMTYSGETNYIINSGAISPKSLLKVHNNISNVVKILQEKVSLLENTFIAGLKSVLSGDMYSLATILYPEDFEQNDNTEQDIMVIPE